jgi:hypothetical protein
MPTGSDQPFHPRDGSTVVGVEVDDEGGARPQGRGRP